MDFVKIFKEIECAVVPILRNYRDNVNKLKISLKEDKTFLTEADLKIQKIIIDIIKKYDINPNIIAEEKNDYEFNQNKKDAWIIDPIDGTSQFIDINKYEYCSCVCYMKEGLPIASMIVMPDLGINRTKLTAVALLNEKEIYINDNLINYVTFIKSGIASTTRSKGTIPSNIENSLISQGYQVKSRTTSQSIDLLRTAIDISNMTEDKLKHFDLFYREHQKIWDGAPGFCFNLIVGKRILASNNEHILPFDHTTLNKNYITESVLVADEKLFNNLM